MTTELLTPLPPGAPDPERSTWIRKTPGVCGGDACIRNTRIPVWLLVEWRRLGLDDQEILTQYPGLAAEDLAGAWEYVRGHREEIEEAIRENDEA